MNLASQSFIFNIAQPRFNQQMSELTTTGCEVYIYNVAWHSEGKVQQISHSHTEIRMKIFTICKSVEEEYIKIPASNPFKHTLRKNDSEKNQ